MMPFCQNTLSETKIRNLHSKERQRGCPPLSYASAPPPPPILFQCFVTLSLPSAMIFHRRFMMTSVSDCPHKQRSADTRNLFAQFNFCRLITVLPLVVFGGNKYLYLEKHPFRETLRTFLNFDGGHVSTMQKAKKKKMMAIL